MGFAVIVAPLDESAGRSTGRQGQSVHGVASTRSVQWLDTTQLMGSVVCEGGHEQSLQFLVWQRRYKA